MTEPRLPTPVEVVQHAEMFAAFFRTLTAEGVPDSPAAVGAAMYVASVLARLAAEPHEPWETEG